MAKSFKQARIDIVTRGLKRTETDHPAIIENQEFHKNIVNKNEYKLRGQHGCTSTDTDELKFYEHFKNL